MSTTNTPTTFPMIDALTADWLIPYALSSSAIAVGIGDLCYDNGSDVAYPADQLTSLGTELADQISFASKFVGISQEQVLSTETNSSKRFTLRQYAVVDMTCASNTFNKGDLVGIFSNGSAVSAQKLDKVLQKEAAIGVVIKYYSAATTTVRCLLFANKYWDLATQALNRVAVSTIAVAGTNQATANVLNPGANLVTGANASAGVVLPIPVVGMNVPVKNNVASTLLVYPNTGAAINALGANAVYNIGNNQCTTFYAWNSTNWFTFPLVAS